MNPPLLDFSLPDTLPLLNVWQRWHWRDRKRFSEGLSWSVRAHLSEWFKGDKQPIERCLILIERRSKPPLPDWDGLAASPKALMDCLVVPSKRNPHGIGIIRDDNPTCAGLVLTLPEPLARGEIFKTRVRIYPDSEESLDLLTTKLRHFIAYTRALSA